MRLRLLPIVLFAGTLLLTIRVGGLWHDLSITAGSRTVAETKATPSAAAAPSVPDAAMPALPATPVSTAESAPAFTHGAPAAEGDAAGAAPAPMKDPFAYTDEEISVLQSLSKRREELDGRAQQLDEREALLAVAEKRVDEKIAELKALQQSIEGVVKQRDAEQEQKLKSLVKIYENMKPKEAAQIFQQLDMDVLLDVVERMKEPKVALIMAQMDPTKAKEVTLDLAQWQKLPAPK